MSAKCWRLWVGLCLSLMLAAPASAQEGACPAIVEAALASTGRLCAATGRNQLCYGADAAATQQADIGTRFEFAQAGDRVNVAEVESLRLAGLDLDAQTWGVALARLQAGLPPDAPDEGVTLLFFGDVEVTNQVDYATLPPTLVEAFARQSVNVRGGPTTNAPVVAGLAANQAVTADGRLRDNSWIRIQLPGAEDERGWVFADLLRVPDLEALKVMGAEGEAVGAPPEPAAAERGAQRGPMQAFTLRTDAGALPCPQAASGLLVQTPDIEHEATLTINGVTLQLASTAYIEARAGAMTVAVIEGAAQVTARDVTRIVPAGARVRVPVGASLSAAQPPGAPEPYDAEALQALPLAALPRIVALQPPLTPAEIAALALVPRAGEWEVALSDETLRCPGTRARFPAFPAEPYMTTLRIAGAGGQVIWGETPYPRAEPGVFTAEGSFTFRGEEIAYVLTVRVVEADHLDTEGTFTSADGCALTISGSAVYAGDAGS